MAGSPSAMGWSENRASEARSGTPHARGPRPEGVLAEFQNAELEQFPARGQRLPAERRLLAALRGGANHVSERSSSVERTHHVEDRGSRLEARPGASGQMDVGIAGPAAARGTNLDLEVERLRDGQPFLQEVGLL